MGEVLFIGCRKMGYDCLEMISEKHKRDVSYAITFDEEMAPKIAGFKSFDELCMRRSIELIKVTDINHKDSVKIIRDLKPRLIIQVAWTQLFSSGLFQIPDKGCVGFHSSLLPAYRGGSPVNWGIINGESSWGVTMFFMNENVDEGDVIDQVPFDITVHDTCKTVYEKATDAAKDMLDRHWQGLIAGNVKTKRQSHNSGDRCRRRTPQEGLIDWSKTARELYDWIRALTHPYPGAFTYYKGKKMYIWDAEVLLADNPNGDSPAKIIGEAYGTGSRLDAGVLVSTNKGALVLRHIQFEDEAPLKGKEIARRLKRGDIIGKP